jgi:hypothetical protein
VPSQEPSVHDVFAAGTVTLPSRYCGMAVVTSGPTHAANPARARSDKSAAFAKQLMLDDFDANIAVIGQDDGCAVSVSPRIWKYEESASAFDQKSHMAIAIPVVILSA